MAAKKIRTLSNDGASIVVHRRRRWRRRTHKRVIGGFSELFAMAMLKLTEHGKKPEDVLWVGTEDGRLRGSWADFQAITTSITLQNLVVAGDGWWLVRQSVYVVGKDSQKWRFIEPPMYLPDARPLENWKEMRKR